MILITLFIVLPFTIALIFLIVSAFDKTNRKYYLRVAGIAALVWLFACSINAIISSVQ